MSDLTAQTPLSPHANASDQEWRSYWWEVATNRHLENADLTNDFLRAMKALEDLSFACFAGIGLQVPSMDVYNDTFKVLDSLRKKRNGGKPYGGSQP